MQAEQPVMVTSHGWVTLAQRCSDRKHSQITPGSRTMQVRRCEGGHGQLRMVWAMLKPALHTQHGWKTNPLWG